MKPAAFRIVIALVSLLSLAWGAPPQFSLQRRIGLTTGDQWEPAMAADGFGRIYVLYPHYGSIPACSECRVPSMLLVTGTDNGKNWQAARVVLPSSSGQFDAQIAVDPIDRHTLYAAWLQGEKHQVIVGRSVDAGATWSFGIAANGTVELDKPVLAVRGQNVLVGFNHEEDVWIAHSQDGGRNFESSPVNAAKRAGWALLGGATIDPAGNSYLAWASYSKSGGARGSVDLYIAKSVNSGKNWAPTKVDTSSVAPECTTFECAEAFLGAQITLASDAGGTLYALWSAGSRATGPQRIYFSASTNGGESWLPRKDVSEAGRAVEHAFPAIVAGNAGDVRIAWMDMRKASRWNTFYRSSSNGGATWSDETRLSNFVPGFKYIGKNGFKFPFGDYFSLAIDNLENTHAVWGEGLNYQSPGSIWYSTGR